MVAMQATLLSGSKIGAESIVGANALVGEGKTFPPRSLIVGVPAQVRREVTAEQVQAVRENAQRYAALAAQHRAEQEQRGR